MSIFESIISFFRKIFKKENEIKMIEAPTKEEGASFITSLKINIKSKKQVETLTCVGDGLGIQTKIEY